MAGAISQAGPMGEAARSSRWSMACSFMDFVTLGLLTATDRKPTKKTMRDSQNPKLRNANEQSASGSRGRDLPPPRLPGAGPGAPVLPFSGEKVKVFRCCYFCF